MSNWRNPLTSRVLGLGPDSDPAISTPRELTSDEIKAREDDILGRAPRIGPLAPEDRDPQAMQAIADLRQAVGAGPTDEMPEFFATMLRHPVLMQHQIAMSAQFHRGYLSFRDRQLAILRTGWLCQAPYEWGEHVQASKRLAGMTSEEIDRVSIGSSAPEWNDHERAILRAVEELFEHANISDSTWEVLARTLDDRQLLELPVLIGTYQSIAYLQNAVRMRLAPGNLGLTSR